MTGSALTWRPCWAAPEHGFSRKHPLLTRVGIEPELYRAKLIAEPWDPGPGGYQLGDFPIEWAEWNDRYRDSGQALLAR